MSLRNLLRSNKVSLFTALILTFITVLTLSQNNQVIAQNISLAAPATFPVACSVNSRMAIFSWQSVAGADKYLLRVNKYPFNIWAPANKSTGDYARLVRGANVYRDQVDSGIDYQWSIQALPAGVDYSPRGSISPWVAFRCNSNAIPTPTPTLSPTPTPTPTSTPIPTPFPTPVPSLGISMSPSSVNLTFYSWASSTQTAFNISASRNVAFAIFRPASFPQGITFVYSTGLLQAGEVRPVSVNIGPYVNPGTYSGDGILRNLDNGQQRTFPMTIAVSSATPVPTPTSLPSPTPGPVNLTPPSGSLTPYGSASITVNVTSRVSSGGYTNISGRVSGTLTNMQPSRTYDVWFVSARGYTPVGARITADSSGRAVFQDISFSEREDNSARVGLIRVAYAFESNNPAPNECSQYQPCLEAAFRFPQ